MSAWTRDLRQSMQTKEQQMKSKTKNKLVAFVKEAIRAAVAAIMGVAGAALAGCTAPPCGAVTAQPQGLREPEAGATGVIDVTGTNLESATSISLYYGVSYSGH